MLCVGEKYADVFLMAQVKGTPYKSIEIPYSAHGYSNVRSKFYRKLDEDLKHRLKSNLYTVKIKTNNSARKGAFLIERVVYKRVNARGKQLCYG